MEMLGKSNDLGRARFCGCAIFLLLCVFLSREVHAYPGTIDVRVVSSAESLRGQARDLEQTLLATVYSLGGKVGRRSPDSAEGRAERARKTLSEVLQRTHQRLNHAEVRDLRLVVESVEREFRERLGSVGIELWCDLLQAQATLLALGGHEEQAAERFSFLFNLRSDPKPGIVGEDLPAARAVADKAFGSWKVAPLSGLLFKGLSEVSRVFVDGKPVSVNKQRISGLRVGLHLVQVLTRDAPPFGAVVRVQGEGLSTVAVKHRSVASVGAREEAEKAVFAALLKDGETLAPELPGLPSLFGVDGILFVALRGDHKKEVAVRGVLVHKAHSPRSLVLTLKPGVSVRRSLDAELKKLLVPPEAP